MWWLIFFVGNFKFLSWVGICCLVWFVNKIKGEWFLVCLIVVVGGLFLCNKGCEVKLDMNWIFDMNWFCK